MAARAKKKFLAKRFAHAISVHYRDFEHAYVYWIWLRGSASYVRIQFGRWRDSFSSAHKARPLNQWQRVLYPNFILIAQNNFSKKLNAN